MKYTNKIITGALSVMLLLSSSACTESFLKEDGGHLIGEDLLKTEDGALAMAARPLWQYPLALRL